MNLRYFRQASLTTLKAIIRANLKYYKSDELWIDTHFGGDNWYFESNVTIPDDLALKEQDDTSHYDFENTVTVYTALKGLNILQATDERLWAYLAHHRFWSYMRKRWNVADASVKDPAEYIRDHYFFMPNRDRALVRNGIARLWWYGYVSYDESRKDPFELTRVLLSKLDITQQLLERTFSRNPVFTRTILVLLAELEANGTPFSQRDPFRDLMKFFNQLGGIAVLDSFTETDLRMMATKKIEELTAA